MVSRSCHLFQVSPNHCHPQPVSIAILSLQVACDLTITITMVYYLRIQCTRVKRWAKLVCYAAYATTQMTVAQDNYCDDYTRALLHH